MSDLSEFLLARIAEDEAAAQGEWDWMIERHGPDAWTTGEGAPIDREWAYEVDRDWTLHVSPRRVLAECEAKREMVDYIHRVPLPYERNAMWGLLALPYASHADYREEWRPLLTR